VPYFNSGTGSWFEGIVWEIEITAKGQPRLVYWDKNSKSPQVMGWELHDKMINILDDTINKISNYLINLLLPTGALTGPFGPYTGPTGTMKATANVGGLLTFDLTSLTTATDHYACVAGIAFQTLKQVFCEGIAQALFEIN